MGTHWMVGGLMLYTAGSMLGWWFYLYQALTDSHSKSLYVAYFVYHYLYYAVSIVYCGLWYRFVAHLRKRAATSSTPPGTLWCIYKRRDPPRTEIPDVANDERFLLQLASRRCSFFHYKLVQVIGGFAVVEIGVAIFFQAYAGTWAGFHIATGISCYPVLLVLPLAMECARRVLFVPEVRRWVAATASSSGSIHMFGEAED